MALILIYRLAFAAFLVAGLWTLEAISRTLHKASMAERHEQWMTWHGRVYRDATEKDMRFEIFKDNVDYIESSNSAGVKPYKLGINSFADLTKEEFQATFNGYKLLTKSISTSFRYENLTTVPSSTDWRKKGAVTPIKDQGQCGLMDDAFKFIIHHKGLTTESNYPYEARDGTCSMQTKEKTSQAAKITGYENVPANSESALLKAVPMQPVAVAIAANGSDFQFYSSGVFNGECGTQLDHGVTAVGYGMWSSQVACRMLSDLSMSEKHEMWMVHYGRVYKDDAEKEMRFKIFKDNMEFIESLNSGGNHPYKVPPSMDWRKKGAVTQVKDQGQCGELRPSSTTTSEANPANINNN
ncbi:hypothetical protein L6452_19930 [Arctium lappa]|uniref:Uncharacterized protein n=1 Tax=Arctium lappa TaxID=4217 RepID=A0ACB9BB82_ARCLA|nr:hypothetical protein L6452_19930 [Arctium lappa]